MPDVRMGRIFRGDLQGPGVPGIRVVLTMRTASGERIVARALSDRKGSYTLNLPLIPEADAGTEFAIALIDRADTVIHRQTFTIAPDGREAMIVSTIPGPLLATHEEAPIALERLDGPLVDTDALLTGLSTVLENISPKGTPQHDRLMFGARCPLPSMGLSAHLYGDAFGVLRGDPQSARRLAETLELLAPDLPPARPLSAARTPCCSDTSASFHSGPALGRGRSTEPIVPRERALPLLAAAAYLEQTGLFGINLGGRAVSILCRIERLGKLFRLGVEGVSEPRALHQLQGMLELGFPFPECPQREIPEMPPIVECEPHWNCLEEAFGGFTGAQGYVIGSVTPAVACPGDTITITGSGFGATPGKVVFGGVEADPLTWTTGTITVVVPPGAGNPLSLKLPPYSRLICGRLIEATPTGRIDATFEIGVPEILAFFAGQRPQAIFCVEPGDPIPVTWRVRGASLIVVQVFNELGTIVAQSNPAPNIGVLATLTAPATTHAVKWIARITASGVCSGPVTAEFEIRITRDRVLWIEGLEITQAIQYYRADQHLTDSADRGPDNSLRLVTGKTAWVRAYLRCGFDASFTTGPMAGVTGALRVERRTNNVWSLVANIPPQNGPVAALDPIPNYAAERVNIAATLNFVVPRAVMTGMLRFTLDVSAPGEPCAATNTASAQVTTVVDLQQTLNAAFITIGYNGPDAAGTGTLTLAAPTLADCTAETNWALTTYPVSSTPNVRIAGTFTTTMPLDDVRDCPGCCSANWGTLLAILSGIVAADQAARPPGETWAYYGLINGGIPVNVPGCNGVATGGLAGQPITYAHEIGHAFGLPHARCGNSGMGNPAYPVFEPYDLPVDVPAMPIANTVWTMASIGEYGLDINNGAIADPNVAHDFMSYCGPPWISIFTHNFLVNAAGLSPVIVPSGAPAAAARLISDDGHGFTRRPDRMLPLIHMLGRIGADGKVEVSSVARLETRYLAGHGIDSGYRAQLVNRDGRVLSQDVVYSYPSSGDCGCGAAGLGEAADTAGPPNVHFKAMLNDVAPGQFLRIVRGTETLWERKRPDSPPVVEAVSAGVDERGLHLKWAARRYAEYARDSWIRWSDDGGRTWNALTIVASADDVELPLEQLPSGTVQFQVLAHDGFSTAAGASERVEIRDSPPAVAILYPRTGDRLYAERQIHLWAAGANRSRKRIADEAFRWFIDGREAGRGSDIWVDNPGPGNHEIRVELKGSAGVGQAVSLVEIPTGQG